MIRGALLALLLATSASAIEYPSGSVTRIYAGAVTGTVAWFEQSGAASVELTAMPDDWAAATNARFMVRGRADVMALKAAGKLDWSHTLAVIVSNYPLRCDAQWQDGLGRVLVSRADDWSTVTAEGTGTVTGVGLVIPRTTLALKYCVTNRPAVVIVATNAADDLDITAARLYGTHARVNPAGATITRRLTSAENQGSTVRMAFEPLQWPVWGDSKLMDGRVYIYWREGDTVHGGHFDWHGVNQTVKTQGNIYGGYLEGRQPPRGSTVWYCLTDKDCKERTNVKQSKEKW